MTEYEMPTEEGFYVAHTSVIPGTNDPYGATIFVLDEDGQWSEYAEWDSLGDVNPTYPEGVEKVAERYGWKLLKLEVAR